jgi:hypothetical protein
MKNLIRFTDPAGFNSRTLFSVKQGTSFTVPRSKTNVSPTTYGSDTRNNSVSETVGGQLLVAITDAATPVVFDLTKEAVCDLFPGDVVAASAVASNIVTLTVTSPDGTVRTFSVTGVTTVAQILGVYA